MIIITQDPSPQFLEIGDTGVYSITATGASTIYYQWYEAGYTGSQETGITGYSLMPGETGSTLYLPGVTGLQNRARYVCRAESYPIV